MLMLFHKKIAVEKEVKRIVLRAQKVWKMFSLKAQTVAIHR